MATSSHDSRIEACRLNQAAPRQHLIVMHSGNGSLLDPDSGRVFVKPSGMDYERITPEDIVEVKLAGGRVVGGQCRPSVDLPHHLYPYRRMPEAEAAKWHDRYWNRYGQVGAADAASADDRPPHTRAAA